MPELAVVSPARRAVETWEQIVAAADPVPATRLDDRIYENTVDDLLAVIRDVRTATKSLALVGHNPAFEQLAVALDDGAGDQQARTELGAGMPTCAVAVFRVTTPYTKVGPGTARLTAFIVPRS